LIFRYSIRPQIPRAFGIPTGHRCVERLNFQLAPLICRVSAERLMLQSDLSSVYNLMSSWVERLEHFRAPPIHVVFSHIRMVRMSQWWADTSATRAQVHMVRPPGQLLFHLISIEDSSTFFRQFRSCLWAGFQIMVEC